MDRWSGKRAIEVGPDSKKGDGVVLRDRLNSNSCKVPISSDETKSMNFTQFVGSSDKKEKSVLSTYRSSPNGKEVTKTSSNLCGSSSSSLKNEKQPWSQISMDSSESSRGNGAETEILGVSLGRDKRRVNNKLVYGKVKTPEAECSNLPSSSRMKRGFRQRFGLSKQEFHPGPSGQSTSANRGCSPLLSGVISSRFGLDKRLSWKVDRINKRKVYGESSSSPSASVMDVTEPPAEVRRRSINLRRSASDSRWPRKCILNDDNDVASVGSQRSVNRSNSCIRFSNRGCGRDGVSSIRATEMSQTETSNNLNSPLSLEVLSGSPGFGLSGSLLSQGSFHSYNLYGSSEMPLQILPELNRIEQDIELNYEELLLMATGLRRGGLSFHDQHRDMRLDIDNMSYEELLALEERIGTVSTALTEEAISKCLKTSIYQMETLSDHKEDAKCSICQEEYTIGDEVGMLHCEHTYHVKCVQEWLRMKSWCPICKATAETSSK